MPLYGQFVTNSMRRAINDLGAVGTNVRVALCTSAYVPNQNTHENFSQITNQVVGAGYTAGGALLASKTLTYNARVTTFDAADTEWLNSTITARFAVIYDDTDPTPANKKLIAWIDFGSDQISSNGTFRIVWDAAGIFTSTVAV